MSKQFTCDECGSTDLEGLALVTVNSHEFVDWSVAGDADECYCNDCQEWGTCDTDEVVQVECPACGHEGWWSKKLVRFAHCRICDVEMVPYIEETPTPSEYAYSKTADPSGLMSE